MRLAGVSTATEVLGRCRDEEHTVLQRARRLGDDQAVSLLPDLGMTKTHSRPHVPNDNPFSEA